MRPARNVSDNRALPAPAANNLTEFPMTRWFYAAAAASLFLCSAASADEGMWTFHGFPFDQGQRPAEDQPRPGLARPGAPVHRAHRELHRLLRLRTKA